MELTILDQVLDQLRTALEQDDLHRAAALIEALQPADQADLVEGLSDDNQVTLMSHLDPADSADVLEEMEDENAAALAELLPATDLAGILDAMEADEAADVLGDLSPTSAAAVLSEMEEAEGVLPLLQYPDDTAGGLMTPSVVTIRRHMRALEVIADLRRIGPLSDSLYYLFVTDADDKLIGVVGLRDIIAAQPETVVDALMDLDVISVPVTADQEICARTLSRYGFLALPVVDEQGRLVGVITADDLIEVAEDEATEDMYRMVGISGEEQVFGPLWPSVRKRLPWLIINMATLFVAITVVNAFESVIAGMVALATFLPLVSGQGGNAGSQTTTVIVRGMALGEVDQRNGLRALGKELAASFVNGAIVGVGTGLVIYLWKNEPVIAIATAIAMVLNFLTAALVGVLVPLGLKVIKVDPALASAAFVTGFTDTLGFLFFLGLATLLM